MNPEPHEREPESLANEMWFYSLERRSQSAALRRVTIGLAVVAVVLVLAATVQPVAVVGVCAAIAAVVTLETAAFVRGSKQKQGVLAQLRAGSNPQLVDTVGAGLSNRALLVIALAVALVVAGIGILATGQLS